MAAYNLGVLLARRGDLEGAEAAYRRADERGNGAAAYNLGVLLDERGDTDWATAAFERAAASEVLEWLKRRRPEVDGVDQLQTPLAIFVLLCFAHFFL